MLAFQPLPLPDAYLLISARTPLVISLLIPGFTAWAQGPVLVDRSPVTLTLPSGLIVSPIASFMVNAGVATATLIAAYSKLTL